MKKRVYLTYPRELVQESILYQANRKFNVVTNIRQATVSDKVGILALELDGDSEEVEKVIQFFIEKGVKVEPIELDIIE